MVTVNQQYFETAGLRLLRGRPFTEHDGAAGQESAIVNARFAQMHFPDEDPIGRRITLSIDLEGGAPPAGGIPVSLTATIVGIAPNVRQRLFDQVEPDAVAYLPYRMDPRAFINLLVRSDGDPQLMTPIIREEVRALDPDLPVYNIRTMDEALARQRWPFRVFGSMFAIFAAIALLFSAVGLYAVTAYSVVQRTPEIGIRMALGARSGQVMALFLRRAFVQLAIGLALGLAAALGVGKIFESGDLLVQTTARDPLTIGSIALVLIVVATFACLLPARKATVLDPLVALRRE
jgi:putative ABC transport system permease protein